MIGWVIFFININLEPLLVCLDKDNDIDVSFEDGELRPPFGVDSDSAGPVDAADFDSIAGFDGVDQIVVNHDLHSFGSLALGHALGGLLQLDVLSGCELAVLVADVEGASALALLVGAHGRLEGAVAVDLLLHHEPALGTLESAHVHLGDYVRVADHDSLHLHVLVDVRRSQVSHAESGRQVEGTSLDQTDALHVLLLMGTSLHVLGDSGDSFLSSVFFCDERAYQIDHLQNFSRVHF